MSIIVSLLNQQPFIIFPANWLGWCGLVAWLGGIAYIIYIKRDYQQTFTAKNWVLFGILLLSVPITNLFVGTRLPMLDTLPLPEVAIEPKGFALMFFSAVPWVLAAGLLGPLSGSILAGLSGLILGLYDTHSIYTVFELAFMGALSSVFISQNYRTVIYKGLRRPIITAILLCILYPILFSVNSIFFAGGSLTGQIDYAFSKVTSATLAIGSPILFAGIVMEVLRLTIPTKWGGQPPWQPAPAESSLETRFLWNIVPLSLGLIITLMVGDWIFAGNAARSILLDRMASSAEIAAESVPYFLDSGQSLILRLANDPELDLNSPEELRGVVRNEIRSVPFFHQIYVFDQNANALAGYPNDDFYVVATAPDELVGIDLALNGVLVQAYPLPPLEGEPSTQISFIAAVKDENDNVHGVIIGRTDIQTTPLAKPILTSLKSMEFIGGTGFLIDESGHILYHPDPNRLMLQYPTRVTEDGVFYDETGPDGTRQLAYYKPAIGSPWTVVLTLPAQQFQQSALDIAAPLLGMILLFALLLVGMIKVGLRTVTTSLKSLAVETDRIAQGQLNRALLVDGDDEVGQLRRSFEKMRISLKARLDELNRLLVVSRGVASSLDMVKAVRPILEAALATGASSARIVLSPNVFQIIQGKPEMPSRFGLGELTDAYSIYDTQLLELMEDKDRIVLTNPARTTLIDFYPEDIRPESLLSVALHHEDQYFGALWIAYNTPHPFTNEEVRFLTTLAGQAALAASNSRLFKTAEIGHQRLAAILTSTPDPVIVTDHEDRLLLLNPVAAQVFGLGENIRIGVSIKEVFHQPELVELFRPSLEEIGSTEVSLADGRIYLATASSIEVDGQRIGRICVLRDVTRFKELDALKSEFVATVSHDLRSPLTLMRGYATMLEMVGDLNDQQKIYIQKIGTGVESMSQLINNLLDLGRLEAGLALQLEKVPIRDLIEVIVEKHRLQANQKQIKIHLDTTDLVTPIVEADRIMMQQAFQNLLENGIKYSLRGKEIWVRARTNNDKLVVEFQDYGIGISSVDLPRLFEKFYRTTNREARKQSGTGLGLAIVKSIAERHGGRVWVDSKLGKGSTFIFEVPLRQPDD